MLFRLCVLFVGCYISISVEAFLSHQSRIPKKGFFVMPQSSSTQDTTAATNAIPNWRVLSLLPTEDATNCNADICAKLQERAEWSFQKYQDALALYDKFVACSDGYVAPGVKEALNCLDHAYRLYGPHSVLCSFNGGKDAVVILQLLRAAHAHYYRQQKETGRDTGTMVRPRTIYFEHQDEFPQVLSYLRNTVKDYDLDMIAFEKGVNFNQGLKVLVHNNIPPQSSITFPMAFVLGTRVGDPNAGSQGYFAPSSHYMPAFMRVNPVLEWTYGQVWHFLRVFSLPYCILYDQGYTSLGTTKDTVPCPALAVPGSSRRDTSLPKYWPAYMLQDWSQERAGRIKKEQKDKKLNTTTIIDETNVIKQQQVDPPTAAPSSIRESVISISTALRATDPKQIDPVAPAPESDSNVSQDGNSGMAPDDSRSCWSYGSNHSLTQRTVGLLVIGDEILKGSTADTNTMAAAKSFREKSVLLKKVVVLSDEQEAIVNEILAMQNEVGKWYSTFSVSLYLSAENVAISLFSSLLC
jgi:FAD synthetase